MGSLNISVHVVAFILTFLLTLITGPILIPVLRRLKFGQTVRDDGPSSHLKKTGTPTMGGIIFLIPLLLVSILYSVKYPQILALTFATMGFGIIGYIDDYKKVKKRSKDGLNPNQKMLGLLIIAVSFTLYVVYGMELGTDIIIPFKGMSNTVILPEWIFIPFTVFLLLCSTNSVNMTDGLDGLAAGVTLVVMVFFTIISMTRNEWDWIRIYSAAAAGGCLGFLAFNSYPARVFMGDSGSLALGGAVGAVAIMTKIPWVLLIVGGIYVVETLSVIIQVISFKTTGKRVFKMAPLHHHFELSGWKETKVVTVFISITIILCILGFILLGVEFI